jgi:ribonuclease HI
MTVAPEPAGPPAEPVVIYTDGGADPNPGLGGWAAIIRFGRHERVLSGAEPDTTNNRMELTAAIAALQALTRPCRIQFHTDSEYLRRGITEWVERWAAKNWRRGKQPVANADLWQTLRELSRRHQIEWFWVRGHSGHEDNERVDELARQARLAITASSAHDPALPRLFLRASVSGNPGPGGWGLILERDGQTEQFSGTAAKTTNNRLEIEAAVAGLRLLPPGQAIQLFTVSDYLYQGATQWLPAWRRRNWLKKDGQPVSHADLWQQLGAEMERRPVQWLNVKGVPEPFREVMEEAARVAAEAARLEKRG